MQRFKKQNGNSTTKAIYGESFAKWQSFTKGIQPTRATKPHIHIRKDETCMIAHSLIRAKPRVRMENDIGDIRDNMLLKKSPSRLLCDIHHPTCNVIINPKWHSTRTFEECLDAGSLISTL
ncbi:hypothetical protein Tco_1056543 [Tanacetum coccineum]|uniref:Uncharacterized protein n=1 Tax=Tanacetum coccineum TaxID=301880 RepID=A0ABQ5H2Z1_9ASTR